MKTTRLVQALALSFTLAGTAHAGLLDGASQAWSNTHAGTPSGFLSEIVAFDSVTKTLWVSGVNGVNVLDAKTGASLSFIDTSGWGSINSVAIHNGVAAFAIESTTRTQAGVVQLYDTSSRSLLAGNSTITVGALPDMLTFTPDGSRLLVANEGTPATYGSRIGSTVPRNYGTSASDPVGSVSIIDVASRSVVSTATLAGVAQSGTHIRTNTGMDFEPEYITVNKAGTQAYVSLQEANAMVVLDLQSGQFTKVVGLGAKDFSAPGNAIDAVYNDGKVSFEAVAAKGLYMPDGMASFTGKGNKTYVVMANEGDFREDDGDRSAASSVGATGPTSTLRISNTDSSPGDLYAAGARSFSIRDTDGNLVYDSGNILDVQANLAGIYNDNRSRDKGVEPEGVEVMEIAGKTFAFIGLERTTTGAIAVFEIDANDPSKTSFVRMLTMNGQIAPEGMKGFTMDGVHYLAVSAEGADGVGAGTALFALAPVPEPSTYAMLLGGLGLVGWMARRKAPTPRPVAPR